MDERLDPTNINTAILASVIQNIEEKMEEDAFAKKNEKIRPLWQLLNRFQVLRNFLFFLLFCSFFFQKPVWCHNLGDQINSDCSEDIAGVKYNTVGFL